MEFTVTAQQTKLFNPISFRVKTIYNGFYGKGHILTEFHAKNLFLLICENVVSCVTFV